MSADRLWERWYALPAVRRSALVKQYGSEFSAAWALFGGL